MTDLPNSVATIVNWLQHAGITDMRDVKSTLIGGDPTSQQLREELLDQMHQFGFENVEDLNPESKPDAGPRRFVVDASDGIIKQNVMPSKPEDPDLRTAKLARTQSLSKMTLQPEITEL
jgi:organic radical activating enzyme